MRRNGLRAKCAAGERAVGAWCTLGSTFAAELSAFEGFDYVCIDLQHGLNDFGTIAPMLCAAGSFGASPIVRVPGNRAHHIGRALDAGAEAVVVPMVGSREEAELAVASCRYAPEGVRSFGPVRSRLFLNRERPRDVNDEAMCLVMIETIAAVEQAAEICSAPGLDGVYVGPADLAVTMGLAPGFEEMPKEHADAVRHVLQACQSRGLIAGVHTESGDQAREYLDLGFSMATVSTDAALLKAAHRSELARARGAPPTGGPGPPHP